MFKHIFKQSSSKRIEMITEGNIFKTFLFLSLPGIMMVFINAFMPVLDGIFIFNFDNAVSGAAISYTASIQNIFVLGAQGLSVAGSALIGKANGEGDINRAKRISGQLLSISFLVGLLLIPSMFGITLIATSNIPSEELKNKILTYSFILSLSFPLVLSQASFNSIKNLFGHPEITFLRTLLFVPIKLFFSFMFIAVLKMGVVGAALSALCAYCAISIFIIFDTFIKKSDEKLKLTDLKLEKIFIIKLLKLGWPAVLQSSTKSLSFFLIKLETASYGNIALSAQSISSDVTNMFQNFTVCFDAAIIAFVSINAGAGNEERAKKSAYLAVKMGVILSLILSVLCITLAPYLVGLYTRDTEIYDIALRACYIISLGFTGFSVMFNEMPTFIGLGLNKASLFIQTMRIWVIRLVALYSLYFFVKDIGVDAVFISFTIANILGGVISHMVFRKIRFKL